MDEDDPEITQYIIKAALTNLDQRFYTAATFLVPNKEPNGRISSFKIAFDDAHLIYHIEARVASPLGFSKFDIPLLDVVPAITAPEEHDPCTASSPKPAVDMEAVKTAEKDDGSINIKVVDQAIPVADDQITTIQDTTQATKQDAADLLKRSNFNWGDESEELGATVPSENVQGQGNADTEKTLKKEPEDLLKPFSFDWGDESEVLEEPILATNIQASSLPDVEAPLAEAILAMPVQDAVADTMADDAGSSGTESSSSSDSGELATPDTPLSEYSQLPLTFDTVVDKVKGKGPSLLVAGLDLPTHNKPGPTEPVSKINKFDWLDIPITATQRTKVFPTIPWRVKYVSPNIREFIPKYPVDDVNIVFENLPLHLQTDYGWGLAHKFVEWNYMVLASQMLREQNQYKRRELKPHIKFNRYLERLVDHKVCSIPKVIQPPLQNGLLHHYNFMQMPVCYPSATPPEVSLWAAYMFNARAFEAASSGAEPYLDSFSHKGVLVSQAYKLIDPFVYYGPEYLLHLYKGSKLRGQITGYVHKVYRPNGTWHNDRYQYEQEKPRAVYGVETFNDIDDFSFGPQPSTFIDATEDLRIPSINDDGRPQKLPPPDRWIKAVGWDRKGLPKTRLSMVENVTDMVVHEEVEHPMKANVTSTLPTLEDDSHPMPVLPSCNIPHWQIEEDSDDEDLSVYGRFLGADREPKWQITPSVDTNATNATEPCGDSSNGEVETSAEYSPFQPELAHNICADFNDAMEDILYGHMEDQLPQPDEDLFTAALQQEILETISSTEEAEPASVGLDLNDVMEDIYTVQQSLFQHDGTEGTRAKVRLGPAPIEPSTIDSRDEEAGTGSSKQVGDEETKPIVQETMTATDEGCAANVLNLQDNCNDGDVLQLSREENVTNTNAEEAGGLDTEEAVAVAQSKKVDSLEEEEKSIAEVVRTLKTKQNSSVPAVIGQEHGLETEAQNTKEPGTLLPIESITDFTNDIFISEEVETKGNDTIGSEHLTMTPITNERSEPLPVLQSPWASRNDLADFTHKVSFNEYFYGTFAIGIGHQALKAMSWIDKVIRY